MCFCLEHKSLQMWIIFILLLLLVYYSLVFIFTVLATVSNPPLLFAMSELKQTPFTMRLPGPL